MHSILLAFVLAQPSDALPLPPGSLPLPPGMETKPVVPVQPKVTAPAVQAPQVAYQQIEVGRPLLFPGLRGRRVVIQREAVQALPVPFEPPAKPTVDDSEGPWLPRAEQVRVKAMWPKGVEFPSGLLFYDLPRRYQSLFTMNNGRSRLNVPTELEDGSLGFHANDGSFTDLQVSGGMAHIPASGWNSVKGLAVPTGKLIRIWSEDADVRAFAEVPRWRWTFPVGTVAVDALFSGGMAFEIRTQVKGVDGWETKIIYKNASAVPDGFRGAGQSCASCHNMPARIVDVPGRIYRHVVWGDDGRFSWRPFNEDGTIDRRWPLHVESE